MTTMNWRKGLQSSVIVSDEPYADAVFGSGVEESSDLRYYGGYLIAESVPPSLVPLISAAPEMLEALRALAAELPKVSTREWVDRAGIALVDPMTMASALSKLRRAIEKAEAKP